MSLNSYVTKKPILILIIGIIIGFLIFYLINNQKKSQNCNSIERFSDNDTNYNIYIKSINSEIYNQINNIIISELIPDNQSNQFKNRLLLLYAEIAGNLNLMSKITNIAVNQMNAISNIHNNINKYANVITMTNLYIDRIKLIKNSYHLVINDKQINILNNAEEMANKIIIGDKNSINMFIDSRHQIDASLNSIAIELYNNLYNNTPKTP